MLNLRQDFIKREVKSSDNHYAIATCVMLVYQVLFSVFPPSYQYSR